MSTICTVTLTDLTMDTKKAEVQRIADACDRFSAIAQTAGNKLATSGNIVGERGQVLGTWSYTGTAGS